MTDKLHYDFDLRLDDPVNAHALQFSLIPAGAKVLDVGCGTGIIGEALRVRKNCVVDGVDFDEAALNVASEHLRRIAMTNLEQPGWADQLSSQRFSNYEVVLFGDVLEHTRNPTNILAESQKLLAPGGRVIVSVPNVAYIMVRLRMLFGIFEYADSGIMDRTHLRFFTRATARKMIEDSGLRISSEHYASFVLPWGRSMPAWIMRLCPGLLAAGFVFAAEPIND